MSIQKQLISFAFERAYPYIIEQPTIKGFLSQISFILVGSAATGLCNAGSDVDICLICDQNTYDTISVGTRWLDGRPTEVILDGTQPHYYAISTESLNRKIAELDGLTFIKLKDDKIAAMDEYWADDGEAPKWRQDMKIGRKIK